MPTVRQVSVFSTFLVIFTFILCAGIGFLSKPQNVDKHSCALYISYYESLSSNKGHYFDPSTIALDTNGSPSQAQTLVFRRPTGEMEIYGAGYDGAVLEREVFEEFEYDMSKFYFSKLTAETQTISKCFKGRAESPKFSKLSYEDLIILEKSLPEEEDVYTNKWKFSNPVFSKNGDEAALHNEVTCGGLCGGASIILFKKKNGSWKMIGQHTIWVS